MVIKIKEEHEEGVVRQQIQSLKPLNQEIEQDRLVNDAMAWMVNDAMAWRLRAVELQLRRSREAA